MRPTSVVSPAHWSKDFVEHLRTVHFTLIGVSAGLILIVLSAKPYDSTAALRELHQIMELKKLWSIKWVTLRGGVEKETEFQPSEPSKAKPKADGSSDLTSDPALGTKKPDPDLATVGKMSGWNGDPVLPPRPDQFTPDIDSLGNLPLSLPKDKLLGRIDQMGDTAIVSLAFNDRYWVQQPDQNWSPEAFPSTLAEFKDWWHAIEGGAATKPLFREHWR
jgi:hypothetical protein